MIVEPSSVGYKPNDKLEPSHFGAADFSTMRRIDNSSILEMMRYDVHLFDTPRLCGSDLKDRFSELLVRYVTAEKYGREEDIDYYLAQLSNLLLGGSSNEDIQDLGIMEFHLNVQRLLRDPIHRSHTRHLLGVCLFSTFLMESDIDLETLARTREHFFPLLAQLDFGRPQHRQDESKSDYYPGDSCGTMDRGVYPAGELLSVKLRKYLAHNKEPKLRDAVCLYFDPYIWLNLYHDVGYVYELETEISERIYAEYKNEFNTKKHAADFDLESYRSDATKLNRALEYILSLSLCLDPSRDQQKEALKECANRALTESNRPDHGVVSSLIMFDKFLATTRGIRVADYEPQNLRRYKEYFLRDELGAICLHNLKLHKEAKTKDGNVVRLGFTDSPHYFLLKFADVVSDWGRIYRGRVTAHDFPLLDYVYVGFQALRCTTPEGKGFTGDDRGLLINVVFDFSNNERLLRGEVGQRGRGNEDYPRRVFEVEEFIEKREELQSLSYLLEDNGEKYQWFFFNFVLIDRFGERFLLENSKNNVDLWWLVPPLFQSLLGGKKLSRFNYNENKFEPELP